MSSLKWALSVCTILVQISFIYCLVLDGEIAKDKEVLKLIKNVELNKTADMFRYCDFNNNLLFVVCLRTGNSSLGFVFESRWRK